VEKPTSSSQQVRLTRIPRLNNLEVLHARYTAQTFTRHTHEEYAIGVIERGALGFYYRHVNWVASAGAISLCIPGEIHTGQAAADEGWMYRMFYLDPQLMCGIASEIASAPSDVPFFRSGVVDDPELAASLLQLHIRIEQQDALVMEIEAHFIETLSRFIIRYADKSLRPRVLTEEPDAVASIKGYLQDRYAEDISLDDLSQLTHFSRFHLLRVFRQQMGVPPHTYLRQVRLRRAKQMLTQGTPIAEVAAATGFADQSHLTKWFKRLWGFTPREYSNSILYT
jgi:AraC-like DNA-binding protein